VDEIIVFNNLGREQIKSIVDIQLNRLRQNLASRKMSLDITDRAKALLADKGYDPVYGARPLKRTIQRLIQDPLAVKILAGEFKEGDRVHVDAVGEEFAFDRGGGAAADQTDERPTLH
jgi:ATP-dependent Clp protease ATP-binding subunit ClpB